MTGGTVATAAGTDAVRLHRRPAARGLLIGLGAVSCAVAAVEVHLAVAALAVALFGLVVADRPTVAAVAAVGLVFSNVVVLATTHHGLPGLSVAAVPLLFVITLAHRVIIERRPVVLPAATPWVVALLVVQLVGALSSRDPEASAAEAVVFVSEGLLLFVLVATATQGRRVLRQATLVLVVIAAALSTLSLHQSLTGSEDQDHLGLAQVSEAVVAKDEITEEGRRRHAGPIGEQNRWAQCLAVVLPLAVALAATDRRRWGRAVGALGAVAIGAGIVLTYSRGAAVGLLLAGAVATALRWIPRRAALVGGAVAVAGLLVFAPVYVTRASTVVEAPTAGSGRSGPEDVAGQEGGPDSSFANRTVEASAAFAVFVHHPVVGVGPGMFPGYFQDEARRLGADRIVGVDRQAHNLYLGLAAETGFLGLVAFGGVLVALFVPLAATRRAHRRDHPDVAGMATGYAVALVVYLATGLFLHLAYIRYFWLMAALAAAVGLVREHRPDAPDPGDPSPHLPERTVP